LYVFHPIQRAGKKYFENINPYPCGDAPPKLRLPVGEIIRELKQVAREHPFVFSAGAIAAGIGAILAAPALVTIGTGIMWIGGIITATGFLSAAFVEKREAERWIAVGLLALLGGAGIALTGYLLAVAGFCATAGGAGWCFFFYLSEDPSRDPYRNFYRFIAQTPNSPTHPSATSGFAV